MASVVIPMHQRVRDKNAILLRGGFLPKSNVTWADCDQKRGKEA